MLRDTERWTISELRGLAAIALAQGYEASANGQISPIPDSRTIRYYGTLGLIDKPAEMRGRTAYYTRRHLLQLVAIKRLQGENHSLSEIQEVLAGLSISKLERVANVPQDISDTLAGTPDSKTAKSKPGHTPRDSFWRSGPTESVSPDPRSSGGMVVSTQTPILMTKQVKLQLATGIHLLVETENHLSEEQLRVIRIAAQELLDTLNACGLRKTP